MRRARQVIHGGRLLPGDRERFGVLKVAGQVPPGDYGKLGRVFSVGMPQEPRDARGRLVFDADNAGNVVAHQGWCVYKPTGQVGAGGPWAPASAWGDAAPLINRGLFSWVQVCTRPAGGVCRTHDELHAAGYDPAAKEPWRPPWAAA